MEATVLKNVNEMYEECFCLYRVNSRIGNALVPSFKKEYSCELHWKESPASCCGRARCRHHSTNGQCFADGNKFSDPQWDDKCMIGKISGPASFRQYVVTLLSNKNFLNLQNSKRHPEIRTNHDYLGRCPADQN